jgi:hypothetical protein
MSEPLKRRLKKLESKLPPPPPAPGEDDPQLVDALPLAVRLALILAQERALLHRGTADLVEGDLPAGYWTVLREWDQARAKLNRALKQARRRAGVPPGSPHAVAVRELPLPPDVKQLLERWEMMVSVDGDDRGSTGQE